MNSSKIKTLLIYQFLEKYSDEDNPISTTDLIKLLEKQGITCERKSIYSDIKALNSINIPVVSASVPKKGFYLAARKFEPAEVRLLIDAVNSAGFITPKKTADLTEKLNNLLSVYQSEELASQVYCEQANKCNNEEIYHTINVLDSAIKNCEKVKFQHRTRKIDKEKRKSYTTKTFIVSPYGLVWKNDNYYLICNKESHNNLISMRLDRIRNITVLKTPARPVWECCDYKDGFDVADYTSKMFNMFGGEIMPVTFVCDLDLREQILDRFGEKVKLIGVDINHFSTTVDVAVSDGLASWIMQFGNKIRVQEPACLVDLIKDKTSKIAKLYQ